MAVSGENLLTASFFVELSNSATSVPSSGQLYLLGADTAYNEAALPKDIFQVDDSKIGDGRTRRMQF
jgi:hypothetical protein